MLKHQDYFLNKHLPGSTMPELLVSMIIITIITYYCSINLNNLYKGSSRSLSESQKKIDRINMMLAIDKDFLYGLDILRNYDRLQIRDDSFQNKEGTGNHGGFSTIEFRGDTIIRTSGSGIQKAVFNSLEWDFIKDTITNYFRLEIKSRNDVISTKYIFNMRISVSSQKDNPLRINDTGHHSINA